MSRPGTREVGGGGHSPWFWVPTRKCNSGAVAVNAVYVRKKGTVTDPSTLRRGAVRRGILCGGAVVLGLSSLRKASWISYN